MQFAPSSSHFLFLSSYTVDYSFPSKRKQIWIQYKIEGKFRVYFTP
jgi:hypothetical protein